MKIVVVGGSGLIGSRLCSRLCGMGHEVFDASPVEGVDAVTGEGLAAMLEGAQVVVDVSDGPSGEGGAPAFFRAAGQQLMAAEIAAGVRHHLVLSIVGADRLAGGAYFRAKLQQEDLVRASGIPYTIVRSTQFIDFLGRIADHATTDGTVRLPDALVQPVDADEVADGLAACAVDGPQNRIVEIAGPASVTLDHAVRRYLAAVADPRPVGVDASALFFGSALMEQTLLPGAGARLGNMTLDGWAAKTREGLTNRAEWRHD
jgi:uncharacterized protein YbjT (DUF2867 family)